MAAEERRRRWVRAIETVCSENLALSIIEVLIDPERPEVLADAAFLERRNLHKANQPCGSGFACPTVPTSITLAPIPILLMSAARPHVCNETPTAHAPGRRPLDKYRSTSAQSAIDCRVVISSASTLVSDASESQTTLQGRSLPFSSSHGSNPNGSV